MSPPAALLEILSVLSKDPKNTIIIVSGRERRFIESWLGELRIGLAAEWGFFTRWPGREWESLDDSVDLSWKELVLPVMKYFTERTPGIPKYNIWIV